MKDNTHKGILAKPITSMAFQRSPLPIGAKSQFSRLEEALAKILVPAVGVGDELSKEEDDGLASYRVGLTHEAIHFHSWRPSAPCWLWISKASAAAGVGFPARQEEVHRFGHLARCVRRVGPPPPLSRSFASALKEGRMAWQDPPQQRIGKRRPNFEDWMEEDDLLEPDRPCHQDLRHKLQRGGGREGAPREAVRREWRARDLPPPNPPPPSRGNSRAPIPSRPRADPMGGTSRGARS